MKKIIILKLCLLFSYSVFAQIEFLNTGYKLKRESIKIALIPLLEVEKVYNQTILNFLLRDTLSTVKCVDLDIVIQNILTDTLLNKTLKLIVAKEYSGKELKHNPNFSKFLDELAVENLKQKLDGADILIIPSHIRIRTVKHLNGTGNTSVFGRFRIYDLNTGTFVFDIVAENKVPYLIHEGELRTEMEVALEAFHPYYYKNFIVRNNIK